MTMTNEQAKWELEHIYGMVAPDVQRALDLAIKALEERPTGEWIPINEKLPEQYSVLCCDEYGEIMVAHPFKDEKSCTGFSAESENCYMFECVAWMPLPKPYIRGEE